MANWWEAAPVVQPAQSGGNWWDAAPVASQAAPASAQRYDGGVPVGGSMPAPAAPMPAGRVAAGARPEEPSMGALRASVVGGHQGVTLGAADEMFGALAAPVEMGMQAWNGQQIDPMAAYEAARDKSRGLRDQAREEHPVAATLGEVGGALALPGMAARTLPGMLGQSAAAGGAYGFAGTDGGLEERRNAAGIGAAVGVAGGMAARGIGNAVAKRAARRAIPSQEAIKAQSRAAYEAADTAGLTVAQSPTSRLVSDLDAFAKTEGLYDGVHPRVSAAMRRLSEIDGTTPNLTTLDNVRKVLGAAARSPEADERRIASMVIDRYDDFLEALTPRDVIAGNAKAATSALAEARKEWNRFRKSEAISNIFETARNSAGQYSVSGMENSLRSGFRQLANNPKRLRAFTEAERKAIQGVARGDPITNAMRLVGKLAIRGPVSAIPTMGAVGAGNPLLGAGMAALGEGAKFGAAQRTMSGARGVDEMIRSGGNTLNDLMRLGGQGQGAAALGMQRARALEDSIRLPLSAIGGQSAVRR